MKSDIDTIAEKLKPFGSIQLFEDKDNDGSLIYSVNLMVKNDVDQALNAAWTSGAPDAFIIKR